MGLLIVAEGMEFSGKSTFAQALAEYLNKKGYPTITTFEPGGTALGLEMSRLTKYPRRYLDQDLNETTRTLMFNAARSENLEKVILPALAEGKHVVCDRFLWSTLVYARPGYREEILAAHKLFQNNIQHDFLFLNDLDYSTFIERRGFRGNLDEIEESLHHRFETMRTDYLTLGENDRNCMILNQNLSVADKVVTAYTRLRRRLTDDRRRTAACKADHVRG